MPLPESWDGVFYSPETNGDMIYDLPPEEFVRTLVEHRGDAEFLIAGAIYDLLANDNTELAKQYLELAQAQLPDAPWGAIPFMVITARYIHSALEQESGLSTGMNNVMSRFFKGGVTIEIIRPDPVVDSNDAQDD